jgi:hypothetical protein
MVVRGRYYHPEGMAQEIITEDPVRREIGKMISCIHAANCSTSENSAEEGGYTEKISGRCFGKNTGMGLFLAKEILDRTGIIIREYGDPAIEHDSRSGF